MNDKHQNFLKNLQKNLEGGAVQPEELVVAIKTVLEVIKDLRTEVDSRILNTQNDSNISVLELSNNISALESKVEELISLSEQKSLTQVKEITKILSSKIDQVEQNIPTLPDLTPLETKISEVEKKIPELQPLETPQEKRDKLESLKEMERLDISAIKGVEESYQKLSDSVINRAIGIVDQRTSYLVQKVSNLSDKVATLGTSSAGYSVVEDEGTPVTARTTMNFVGAGVSVADSGGKTTVTVSGSAGGITRLISSVAVPTTGAEASAVDYVYLVSGTTTFTLPTAVGNTNLYTVKNVGANTVTVDTTSAQTIDGSASVSMPVANQSLDFISDNSNWVIV